MFMFSAFSCFGNLRQRREGRDHYHEVKAAQVWRILPDGDPSAQARGDRPPVPVTSGAAPRGPRLSPRPARTLMCFCDKDILLDSCGYRYDELL